jgi:hypothetical protein
LNGWYKLAPSMIKLDAPGPVMLVLWVISGNALVNVIVPVTLKVIAPPDAEALAEVIASRSEVPVWETASDTVVTVRGMAA